MGTIAEIASRASLVAIMSATIGVFTIPGPTALSGIPAPAHRGQSKGDWINFNWRCSSGNDRLSEIYDRTAAKLYRRIEIKQGYGLRLHEIEIGLPTVQ